MLLVNMAGACAEGRPIKIAGMGAVSGVLCAFDVNSEAAICAAVDAINKAGGVCLADGAKGKITVGYRDDQCSPQDGIATARQTASKNWLAIVGTTCSSVLEPVFGAPQKRAGDTSDSGIAVPIFADVAMKTGLAKVSD